MTAPLKAQMQFVPIEHEPHGVFENNNNYISVRGDTNFGPCILERSFYIYKGFAEHLGHKTKYKSLSARAVHCKQQGLHCCFRNWMSKFNQRQRQDDLMDYVCLTKVECTFLYRAIKHFPDKLARSRQICKVHKVPWKI